jgi:hypothetical protein
MNESEYRQQINDLVRLLWQGDISTDVFWMTIVQVIEQGFRTAFEAGAMDCGIMPSELTSEEIVRLNEETVNEISHVDEFAGDIVRMGRESGGSLASLLRRAEMWVLRYSAVRNIARQYTCGDQKLMWVYGPTEHCEDCLRLNGRVHRASIWKKYKLEPRSRDLACRGYRCQCELVPTTQRGSRGRPPRFRGGG